MKSKLSLARSQTADWTLKEAFRELGLGSQLRAKQINVDAEGTVTIRDTAGRRRFESQIFDRGDLDQMVKALGAAMPRVVRANPKIGSDQKVYEVLASIRGTRFENRVNTRWFRDQDFKTELESKYRLGKPFDLPLLEMPQERVDILRVDRKLEGLDLIERYFDRGGHKVFPVHPQEVPFYEKKETVTKAGAIKNVRCASSDRTLHARLPGTPEFLLKVPLPNVLHDDVYRPIEVDEARGTVAMTEFLMQWADSHRVRNDAFCFLPEPMAIADKTGNSSAIVRLMTPYPPPPKGQETWVVQAYSLYAGDSDFPEEAPLAVRMIENRPDESQDPLDYFEQKILAPLVKSTLRVSVDLGSSHVPHGQNLFLELGEDGQPTGRAPHSDLESFWPHPKLARSGKRPDFYNKYGYQHTKSKFESKVWDTYRVYFIEAMLSPLLECIAEYYPDRSKELFDRTDKLLKTELKKRESKLERHKDGGPLRMFHRLLNGDIKLKHILWWGAES